MSPEALLWAVIRDDVPALRTVAPSTPRPVERCVMRCLEKDPRRRYQSAADLKLVLQDLRDDLVAADVTGFSAPSLSGQPTGVPLLSRFLYLGGGAALVAAAVAMRGAPTVTEPRFVPLITEVASVANPSWAPDRQTLAYSSLADGDPQLFIRAVGSPQSTVLARASMLGQPFWAPDGSRLYFVRGNDRNLVSVSVSGGQPQEVFTGDSDHGAALTGRATISPDGRFIIFGRGEVGSVELWTLNLVSREAHRMEPAGLPQPLANLQAVAFSPDGRSVVVLASSTALNQSRGIWLVPWPTGPARHVLTDAPFLASGFSIGWMPDARRVVMAASPLHGGTSRLLMVDATAGTFGTLTGGRDSDTSPTVSSDGRRIAFVSQRSGRDLIAFPIDGGPPEPLISTSRSESYPDMSRSGILAYITDADGTPAVRLRLAGDSWSRAITGPGEFATAGPPGEVRLSPDGQRVAVGTYGSEHLLWVLPTAGGSPVRLDPGTTDQHGPSWSPDGNWVAYRRMANGTWSIVKTPLGGQGAVRLDDADPGGGATDWSPTGEWIAHARRDGLHLISADGTTSRVLGGLNATAFRFSRDGSRLFAIRRDPARQWQLTI